MTHNRILKNIDFLSELPSIVEVSGQILKFINNIANIL